MGLLERLGHRLSDWVDDLAGPDELRELWRRGGRALEAGSYADAERDLLQVTAQSPDAARAWHLLGISQLRQGKTAAARASLQRARELRPEELGVLVALAETERRAGDSRAALQTYKQALQVRGEEDLLDQVFGGLGEIYLEQGDIDHAVRELRKAVALAAGEDLRLLGLLGRAQVRAGDLTLARTSLSRAAAAVPPDPEAVILLSQVLLDLGQPEEARLAALRLLQDDPRSAAGRCALARALLALGRPREANEELLRALSEEPHGVAPHSLLGRAHQAIGDLPSALRHLRTAQELLRGAAAGPAAQGELELLREILSLEIELDACPELGDDASRLLALAPDDPLALAGLALSRLTHPAEAGELLARSLRQRDNFAARLGQGLLHLSAGELEAAAVALRAACRAKPESSRAERLLASVQTKLAGMEELPPAGADLYPLIRRARGLLRGHPLLTGLGTEVARVQEVFDRPLLVTVMGEFNSGKSTFVNALIGERVAPMGVTPTTATINVLKYGQRREARVIWRDDHEQIVEWPEVERFLGSLDRERASDIRLVELLYPSEELLRVNVVDTPGLNSLIEEHEQTARDYMAEADAVIWLFSANQAGKQTEQQALEIIRQHRLKTVGVINKIDRLSPQELAEVESHLSRHFAELTEAVIPVSARAALEAMIEKRLQDLPASRFPALRLFLEERLFARSRAIKREAAQRRLRGLLLQAERQIEAEMEQVDLALGVLDESASALSTLLSERLLAEEARALSEALRSVYRRGAEEVLEFVRPRRWALGEHRASTADRDFLLELLLDGLRQMCDSSLARMTQHLRQAVASLDERVTPAIAPPRGALSSPPAMRSLEQLQAERLALLAQQVYARYLAFGRGFLLGGRVDHFFTKRLPRLELQLEPIHLALFEDSVDLERELLQPLQLWYRETVKTLRQHLHELRHEAALSRLELEHRLLSPVLRLLHQSSPLSVEAPPAEAPSAEPKSVEAPSCGEK